MDCSSPGSSVNGILQARILETSFKMKLWEFPGSLVVRISHFAMAQVQSLVRELRSHKSSGWAK